MEEEGIEGHSSRGTLFRNMNKLLLTFYKNVKGYIKQNNFTETHIHLLKILVSKLYALQTNSLIFECGIFPKILNVLFLVSHSMSEHAEFSPKSMIYFISSEDDHYSYDLDEADIEARNNLEMMIDELSVDEESKNHCVWL